MSQRVIEVLNEARARELTAIQQYMAQHYELEDVDFGKLADKIKEIAIVEMRHAEAFAERILYLKGVPIYKPDDVAKKGEEIPAMLGTDIGLETGAIQMYNASAAICAAEGDHVSKALFEKIAAQEEEHLNYFENTQQHITKLGDAYIATLAS